MKKILLALLVLAGSACGQTVTTTYNSTQPTLTTGQHAPLQSDSSGNLKVNIAAGSSGGSNAAASTTGSAVPSSAGYTGYGSGGNLVGVTTSTPFPTSSTDGTTVANNLTGDSGQNSQLIAGSRKELSYSTTTPATVISVDAGNYACVSVNTQTSGTGSIVTFQQSNSASGPWSSMPMEYEQTTPGFAALNYTTSSAGHVFYAGLKARYFQLVVSGITSGTTAGVVEFFSACRPSISTVINGPTVLPVGAVPLVAASGVVSNATATATLPASASLHTWMSGFQITALGATTAGSIVCTVTGAGTTMSYILSVPGGVLTMAAPLSYTFNPPLESSAVNTALVVSCPAAGVGNTGVAINAQGFQD